MTLKNELKDLVAKSRRLVYGSQTDRVVVLCYHCVHPQKQVQATHPETFERHLLWLIQTCKVIPFREALTIRKTGKLDRPRVAITFDDGYLDNYQYAYPLLKKYGLPATFFLTTGFIEREKAVLDRFDAQVKGPWEDNTPLTWEHIREMRAAGFDMGSHTHRHPNLALLSNEEAIQELADSKRIIEKNLGESVTLLAYPYGKRGRHYTEKTIALATRLGFQHGASVCFRDCRKGEHPLEIPRFFVTNDKLTELSDKIYGGWDSIGWVQKHLPIPLARLLSPADFQ